MVKWCASLLNLIDVILHFLIFASALFSPFLSFSHFRVLSLSQFVMFSSFSFSCPFSSFSSGLTVFNFSPSFLFFASLALPVVLVSFGASRFICLSYSSFFPYFIIWLQFFCLCTGLSFSLSFHHGFCPPAILSFRLFLCFVSFFSEFTVVFCLSF